MLPKHINIDKDGVDCVLHPMANTETDLVLRMICFLVLVEMHFLFHLTPLTSIEYIVITQALPMMRVYRLKSQHLRYEDKVLYLPNDIKTLISTAVDK